ncbi:uncharacterized protein [Eurosta solidaginis]|uniref:uncharacterized protein n=1 Tax=Eurosta solidaginis TaxID=178769 RepID=UPI00353125A3
MDLASTEQFHLLTPNSFNSGGSQSCRLSRAQRKKINKKLRQQLQKNENAPNNIATAAPKINNDSKAKAKTEHTTTSKAESTLLASIKSEKQSSKDNPSLGKVLNPSDMLWQLAKDFHKQIRSLQKVFDAEIKVNSKAAFQRHPPVAEIALKSGSPITVEAYQLLRYIILDSIKKLQTSKKAVTPLFYCMMHKGMYIHILCHDQYAYKCMEDCIGGTMTASVHQLKVSADCVYCFSAIYKAVIKDVKQFMLQIRLHIPKMHTHHWIVVHSRVEHDETHFLFLIYELSALMLEHRYGNRLVINLNEVLFHNHGQLPKLV